MHRFLLCLAFIALASCSAEGPQIASSGCIRSASHDIAWSGVAPDTVTARAEGPSCLQAVVTLTIRNAAGDPLWVHAGTFYDMDAGGAAPANAEAVSDERMDEFLSGWSNVTVAASSTLPEWRADAASLTESATTFAYVTPFDRDTYEGLRQRDLPMLCFAAAVEGVSCLVIDPLSGAPTLLASYGP